MPVSILPQTPWLGTGEIPLSGGLQLSEAAGWVNGWSHDASVCPRLCLWMRKARGGRRNVFFPSVSRVLVPLAGRRPLCRSIPECSASVPPVQSCGRRGRQLDGFGRVWPCEGSKDGIPTGNKSVGQSVNQFVCLNSLSRPLQHNCHWRCIWHRKFKRLKTYTGRGGYALCQPMISLVPHTSLWFGSIMRKCSIWVFCGTHKMANTKQGVFHWGSNNSSSITFPAVSFFPYKLRLVIPSRWFPLNDLWMVCRRLF